MTKTTKFTVKAPEIIDLSALKRARAVMRLDGDDLKNTAERACELAVRLVAAGPKAHAVSASECHEITDAVLHAYDEGNAAGIAATCAAAPALIEIAWLGKLIEQAEDEQAQLARDRIEILGMGPVGELEAQQIRSTERRRADQDVALADLRKRHRAALARVSLGRG